jgi:uncharacterized membrane protein YeaQ/YmgE (transglycosylase-associated protein family)
MSWIGWIVIGIIAGWIAERLTNSRHGLITNLIVGLLGSLIGGWIASGLGVAYDPARFWPSLGVATVGAILLLAVLNLLFNRPQRT